ncbi:hypothetical protein INS49_000072 [Diaporthe citri]|uniref:uncharacterized protein n=1 Tax=Diaporthe citri TaxID=83186 RepID=UPI001C81031F|nr:uncharacterized protein INS49_000072 [Diaporthe citri]KAG6365896.1 hypothetical protein INS49_000072 [Diaporthe citri]
MPSQRPSSSKGPASTSGGTNATAPRPSSRGGSPKRAATAEGPEGVGEVHMVLKRQYITYANGHMYYRKYDTAKKAFGAWESVKDKVVSSASDGLKTLSVVRQRQAPPKGPHWSLFVHENESDKAGGRVWQVWGDHQCMTYYHSPATKLVPLLSSDSYQDHHPMNTRLTKEQEAKVDRVCNTIPAPSAPTPRDIKDNCRTWVIKVLRELVNQGVVKKDDVDNVEKLVGPAAAEAFSGSDS